MPTTLRLVLPHRLVEEHLHAPRGTVFVLIEHDLMFRQYGFHAHKLVLHRATMRRFARRLRGAGHRVETIDSQAGSSTDDRLADLVRRIRPDQVQVFDVVDDYLSRDLTAALARGGYRLRPTDVAESPLFLTSRAELSAWFAAHPPRMQHFYRWQRERLDVLVDQGAPVGGRWSYDTQNRRRLPRDHVLPVVPRFIEHGADVTAAIDWVAREFPEAPGDPATFGWPTSAVEAEEHLETFLAERFADFGPYEDAISVRSATIHHSLLTPMLNMGLLDPRHVLARALEVAEQSQTPLASVEGFVRQLIGWGEYMRAIYHLQGPVMRTSNHLHHHRQLGPGWWTARTGLDPVDLVIGRVLETGYAHHIERLMVLGNAMSLLRIHPDAVHEWFSALFIDAYDWEMVPNVYAMSQFAAGAMATTKPYVSGSNYLTRMSDLPGGGWKADWDGLYWTFVRDHREVFETNPRANRIPGLWDRLEAARRDEHLRRAQPWLAGPVG